MTTTQQPRHPLRWAIRTLRCLNNELLASGEAMARSARAPQPRPQALPAQDTPAHPVSAGTVLTAA